MTKIYYMIWCPDGRVVSFLPTMQIYRVLDPAPTVSDGGIMPSFWNEQGGVQAQVTYMEASMIPFVDRTLLYNIFTWYSCYQHSNLYVSAISYGVIRVRARYSDPRKGETIKRGLTQRLTNTLFPVGRVVTCSPTINIHLCSNPTTSFSKDGIGWAYRSYTQGRWISWHPQGAKNNCRIEFPTKAVMGQPVVSL